MKDFNKKLTEYNELKAQFDTVKKQLETLKAELIADLKTRDIEETDKGLLMVHQGKEFTSALLISNTLSVDTSAVKKAFPGQFLKAGTRENFSVNAN